MNISCKQVKGGDGSISDGEFSDHELHTSSEYDDTESDHDDTARVIHAAPQSIMFPNVSVEVSAADMQATEEAGNRQDAQVLMDGMDVIPCVDPESPAWQAQMDDCIQQLATCLRDKPTIPPDPANPNMPWPNPNDGALWPAKHCAFKGCMWHGDTTGQLDEHLREHHQQFSAAESWLSVGNASKHWFYPQQVKQHLKKNGYERTYTGLYNAAIALKERGGVPSVGCCVDRRAHEAFAKRHSGHAVCAPMCFCCARVLPYDQYYVDRRTNQETLQEPEIRWRAVFKRDRPNPNPTPNHNPDPDLNPDPNPNPNPNLTLTLTLTLTLILTLNLALTLTLTLTLT